MKLLSHQQQQLLLLLVVQTTINSATSWQQVIQWGRTAMYCMEDRVNAALYYPSCHVYTQRQLNREGMLMSSSVPWLSQQPKLGLS